MCRPLRNTEYIGTITVEKQRDKQPHKFIFKRKIFVKNQSNINAVIKYNNILKEFLIIIRKYIYIISV